MRAMRRLGVLAALAVAAGCRSPSSVDARAEQRPAQAKVSPVASVQAPATAAPAPRTLDPRVYDGGAAAPPVGASAAPPGSAGTRAPARQRYVVAVMGDSLSDPRSGGGRFLKYLAAECPQSRFVSRAKGGEMVNQMRRRFASDILDDPAPPEGLSYTDVIVFGGVNDLYSDETAGRTVEKIRSDLAKMYTVAKGAGLRVTAITVTPWGGFTRYFNARRGAATLELNAWIRRQADRGFIDHTVDAYPLLSCGDPTRLCPEFAEPARDGLHFGPKGHAVLGQALHEQVFANCL